MKRTKALLALMLSLLMLLSFFPGPVLAADGFEDFVSSPDSRSGIGWAWDETTKTLTFDGVGESIPFSCDLPGGSTVQVDSDITLESDVFTAFDVEGDLTVQGEGTLTLKGSYVGIDTEGDLTVLSDLVMEVQDTGILAKGALSLSEADVAMDLYYLDRSETSNLQISYNQAGIIARTSIDVEDSNIAMEGFRVGLYAGYEDMNDLSLTLLVEHPITIVNSTIDLDRGDSRVPAEAKEQTLTTIVWDTGISTEKGDITISQDSAVTVDGYESAIVAGTENIYLDQLSQSSDLQVEVTGSGDIDVNNATLLLTGVGPYSDGTAAIHALQGSVRLTNAQVTATGFWFGINTGFTRYMSIPSDYMGLRGDYLPSYVSITNSELSFTGFDIMETYSLKRGPENNNVGIVNPMGPVTIEESTVLVKDFKKGIINGFVLDGALLIDYSEVKVDLLDDYTGDYNAVAAYYQYDDMTTLETTEEKNIQLKSSYILIPEEGTVETFEYPDITQQDVAQTFDYIAPDENGVVHILPYPLVTFDSMGGSDVTGQILAPGGNPVKPEDPTRDGYLFDGWYFDTEYAEKIVFDEYAVEEDVTLYAKWDRPPQVVEFVEEDEGTGVMASGLEDKVVVEEKDDKDIAKITVFVKALEKELDPSIQDAVETALAGKGYELLGVYDIELYKRIEPYEGDPVEEKIDNEDITGPVSVYLPLTAQQAAKEDLAIAYITEDGSVEIIQGLKKTIGKVTYFVFETDHFSDYALVEQTMEANPSTGDGNAASQGKAMDAGWMTGGILLILAMVALGRTKWNKQQI
ncbi:InlB B-repeat-containing protein [Alkalibacter rhizosphaerae]|uniref:InlB B-repeat-containing protein n=1 Tax=Alkalibacter rhizosphaerae TaxID=2815577 RepID=A0A974XG57_9FIRM|nr:InlB B-repeat-containing protein [Alkalibacter rhizosphaerae]QSX09254.1 InlB B-repeat-containing protein [Alkalibacter rhizosphaerae]